MNGNGDFAAAMLDAAPVGLLVVDEIGTITWASASTYDLTGYGLTEVVGTNILDYLITEAVQGVLDSVAYVQEHSTAVMGPAIAGFRHADGSTRYLELYATNHFADPLIGGLVVAVRDQTFQYRVNEALRAYTEGTGLPTALGILCAALILTNVPLRARFELSRAALDQAVARIESGGSLENSSVGLFSVRTARLNLPGETVFETSDSDSGLGACGLAHIADGFQVQDSSLGPSLGDHWFVWCEFMFDD